jgi:hypothetical protein
MARFGRSWLARACAVGILVAAGAAAPQIAGAQEHDHEGDGMLPPGNWTEEQREILMDLIMRTEEDLPQFSDPANLPDGFFDSLSTAPGGYVHYINWDWIEDDHFLDPNFPESLVYQQVWNEETGQTETRLVSVMFILPERYDLMNIPEQWAWMPGWHLHADLCFNDQTHTFSGFAPCGEGTSPWDKRPMLHVWIEDNECGHRFAGIDQSGVECDVSHGGHGGPTTTMPDEHDHMTTTTMPPGSTPPPATPIEEPPPNTG